MPKVAKIHGFHDVSTGDQQRFITARGDVQIREVDPRGWNWDVLPLGGTPRIVSGKEEQGLRDLRANLQSGEATDFDRGYVVGYERGLSEGALGQAFRGQVGAEFGVESPSQSYPPRGEAQKPKRAAQIKREVDEILHRERR